eukprot:GHUV01018453.1.p2 GENE.GHUV01018453.1~~GHUV01018453.1.p2  ORF type:complete len:112 (+),score=27.43 GHUV01018453.1:918-1253(+)
MHPGGTSWNCVESADEPAAVDQVTDGIALQGTCQCVLSDGWAGCVIAGYHGRPSEDLLDNLCVTRYQSSKAALSFADYLSNSHSKLGDVEQLLLVGANSNSGRFSRLLFSN